MTKRFLSVVFVMCAVCMLTPMTAAADDAPPKWTDAGYRDDAFLPDGGTIPNVIDIETAAELGRLAYLANQDSGVLNGKTIRLENDINLAGALWAPIEYAYGFTLDGQGYTISNMDVREAVDYGTYCAGLFGYITSTDTSATGIKNLTLQGNITPSGDVNYVGALVGRASRESYIKAIDIDNVHTDVTIHVTEAEAYIYAGGICGSLEVVPDTVLNCSAVGSIFVRGNAEKDVGGLVGQIWGSSLRNAFFNGSISVRGSNVDWVGGLVGFASGRRDATNVVDNCYAAGTSGMELIGQNDANAPTHCHNDVTTATAAATLTALNAVAESEADYEPWQIKPGINGGLPIHGVTPHTHPVCGATCGHTPSHADIAYQPLYAGASASFTTSGNVYLAEDIAQSQTFHVSTADPDNPTVINLCLNGHKLSRTGGGRAVEVASNATLNICDCDGSHGSHDILNPATTDDAADTVLIAGGVITGSTNGGVVLFGTLNLYGGTIAGNTNASNGGGVNMSAGKFNMYGGTITANRASNHGGGVGIYGEFVMHGGAISGNSTAGNGGGVYANRSDQTYFIYGGTIRADGAEYAVYSQNGRFTLGGAPVIRSGNDAGADIYLSTSATSSLIIAGALTNTTPYRVHKEGGTIGNVVARGATGTPGYTISSADAAKVTCAAPYSVVLDSAANALKLAGHTHPVCGATCGHTPSHGDTIYYPVDSGTALPTTAGSYYLTQDVTLASTWAVPSDTTSLCLNGYTIKHPSSDTSASVIQLGGGSLNVCDCQTTGKVDGENHIGIINGGSGTLTLYSGTVTSTGYRGVHNNTTGSVVVDGGTVISSHNTAVALSNQSSGAIAVKSGSVEGNNVGIGISGSGGVHSISGGTVYGRSFGVTIHTGTLNISGGAVSSNGYALYQGGGTVHFTGGAIESAGSGTAIYFYDQGLAGGGTSSYPGALNIGSGSVIQGSTGAPYDIHLRDDRILTIAGALSNTTPYRVFKANATAGAIIATATTAAHADAGKFASANAGCSLAANPTESGDNPKSVFLVANAYTVTFDANATDATGAMTPQGFTYGVAQGLSPNAFTRPNHDFAGWATSATGAKAYDDGQSVSNLTDVSGGTVPLYAVWQQKAAITVAAVTGVLEPLVGNAPDPGAACASTGVDAVSDVSWTPAHTTFQLGTAYTVHVTLTAEAGYAFATPPTLTASINGKPATVSRRSATEITVSFTFPPAGLLPFTIKPASGFVEGNATDIVFTVGEGMALKISELQDVRVDGRILTPPIEYTVTSGSIVITLKRAYLNTLKQGKYRLRATTHSGAYAETTVVVYARPPKTGDGGAPRGWLGLGLLSAAGAGWLLLRRRDARA